MLRSPSLPLRDYDELSSPDPLGASIDSEIATPVATLSSPTKRRLTSPAKSGRNSKTVNYTLPHMASATSSGPLSPSKTVTEQTLSPWKIRVTVETEPEGMDGNAQTTTRTIKIPLRQDSSPTALVQADGRGRQPNNSTAKSRRSATPMRARSGSRGRRQSLTDLNITVLGDDADSDDWTKQRSPRKRKTSRGRQKSAVVSREEDGVAVKAPKTNKKTKSSAPFEIRQDSDVAEEQEQDQIANTESPELRRIDLNRVAVRSRSQSVKQKDLAEDQNVEDISGHLSQRAGLTGPDASARKVSNDSVINYPTPSPTTSYHGSDEHEKLTDLKEVHENFDTILDSEGFTMIDLDTIPSARTFISSPAIIPEVSPTANILPATSISSTKTRQMHRSAESPPQMRQSKSAAIPSYMKFVEGDSDISSNMEMPSSPPAHSDSLLKVPQPARSSARKVTPESYSSPKLPSPPKQTRRSPRSQMEQQTLPKRVVNAGIALQEVLSPQPGRVKDISHTKEACTPAAQGDNLFEGFDSGTKRELRAGLRFGEELAKRQKSSPASTEMKASAPHSTASAYQPGNISGQLRTNTQTQVWRGETVLQHTPISSNTGIQTKLSENISTSSHLMLQSSTSKSRSVVRDSSSLSKTSTQTPRTSLSQDIEPTLLTTQARREHKWQLEREAISRQIQNATPGKVIVIESDSDDEADHESAQDVRGLQGSSKHPDIDESVATEDDNEDIWLAEAQNSSSSPRPDDQAGLFTTTEQRKQRERAAEVVHRPRRSLIPSPWKRGQDVGEASTFLTNGDVSGIFWQQQPQERIKFGASEIARQKRSLSGSFDVDRMAGTPRNVAATISSSLLKPEPQIHGPGNGEEVEEESQLVEDEPENSQNVGSDEAVEPSFISEPSFTSQPSSPLPLTKIPVNFNDSTLSNIGRPSALSRSSPVEDSDAWRPSTPRSAMKGTRQSIGMDQPDTPPRRVVFNDRSMYLNDDGVESTMSANFDSPQPESGTVPFVDEKMRVEDEAEEAPEQEATETPKSQTPGWLGWLWKAKAEPATITAGSELTAPPTKVNPPSVAILDGTGEQLSDDSEVSEWRHTKASLPSSSAETSSSTKRSDDHSQHAKTSKSRTSQLEAESTRKIPSYLLPPSYPSDPSRPRSPSSNLPFPLATAGAFTNTHFRTLHIIHAKSTRPRFHAPSPASIRPGLRALLGWTMEVDESSAGLGMFEWKVGSSEVEVLERFMREVEWGWIQREALKGKELVEVEWGWTVEELAEFLGRIVVGEVVRKEEGRKI